MRLLLLLFGLVPTPIFAVPLGQICVKQAKDYVDNFDAVGIQPIPATAPVGDTAGGALSYHAFGYAGYTAASVSLQPPSPPNAAGSTPYAQLLQGEPKFSPINTTITSFDLKSLYFLCIQTGGTPAAASVVVPCTIQITGTKATGAATVVQELVNDHAVTGPFNYATLSNTFTGLAQVNLQLTSAPVPPSDLVISIDNVAYRAYSTVCKE